MAASQILLLLATYFCGLIVISYITGKNATNHAFFKAEGKSPWYIVAFGMIGASLSGVTFISVPGWVAASKFGYMQVVLGYTVGYACIGMVLLPLYYKMRLTSIYTYLDHRFGKYTYKTGASFFLISRSVGASFRLFLVANVLQTIVFDALGIPFWATVILTIALIWLYTFQSGIKTIIWTDTLQTLCMLVAVGVAIFTIAPHIDLQGANWFSFLWNHELSRVFYFDDIKNANHFVKQFVSGVFIAIVMTGLDQDMMQKNLSCRNLDAAQKNLFWFTLVLTFVNLIFLILGLLLTVYATQHDIAATRDQLFPVLATQSNLGLGMALFFVLGVIAAAYSSADSALTSLTTSFCIDILDIENKYDTARQVAVRKKYHLVFSLILVLIITVFKYWIQDESVIAKLFVFAGYTYGPLLGLYAFGLFSKRQLQDRLVPVIALLSPLLSYLISYACKQGFAFDFGFFILILNGMICYIGLHCIKKSREFTVKN